MATKKKTATKKAPKTTKHKAKVSKTDREIHAANLAVFKQRGWKPIRPLVRGRKKPEALPSGYTKVFDDCGGSGCVVKPPAARAAKIDVQPTGFSYTTGSREHTLKTPKRKNPKTGKTMGWGTPCGARDTCPVQLVFERGRIAMRFCTQDGKPGRLKYYTDQKTATADAREICKCWAKQARTITRKKKGELVEGRAAPANWVDNCGLATAPLGGLKRKRRRR